MRRIFNSYPAFMSTLAVVIALTGVGAQAAGLITSAQIKNGAIHSVDIAGSGVRSTDIAKSAVQSTDIKTGAVQSSDVADGAVTSPDIKTGAVTPQDAGFPEPEVTQEPTGEQSQATVANDFMPVDVAPPATKDSAETDLEVRWTGSAATNFSPCVFQLRVDGQPATPGAGVIYVGSGSAVSVQVAATFPGLAVGPHQAEVWARTTVGAAYPCTVGPSQVPVPQTFEYQELVH